jgi:hypothetical protein
MAEPVAPVTIDWKKFKEASTEPFINEAAPPPMLEILYASALLLHAAISMQYAPQALCFDPSAAGGTYWQWGQHFGPGTYALRPVFLRSSEVGDESAAVDTVSWQGSATASSDRIDVPAPGSGADVFPPNLETAQVAKGGTEVLAVHSEGDNRAYEVAPATLAARFEEFYGANFSAVSVEPLQVADLNSL